MASERRGAVHSTIGAKQRCLVMRICHVAGWYYPHTLGGTEVYVHGLATGLAQRGCDVHIAAPLASIAQPEEYIHDGLSIFRYPVPARPTRSEAQGEVRARGAEHFLTWLDRLRPDILHVHSLVTGLGLFEIEAARDRGARVVYTNHLPSTGFVCARGTLLRWGTDACDGVQDEVMCGACVLQQHGVPKPLALAVARTPERLASSLAHLSASASAMFGMRGTIRAAGQRQRRLIDLCDRIVALNERTAAILRANGAPAGRVVVNRQGVPDRLRRKPGPSVKATVAPPVVGYIGRLHEVKGLRVLVDAWRQLSRTLPLKLLIAGPTDDEESTLLLRGLQRGLAGDARVTFAPAVPAQHIDAALAALDVLCCPSIWFEQGPLIAVEAMAVGTPVIGTTLGAFTEFIRDGHNGRLVPPNDAAALAEVLQEIAAAPAIVDRWRENLGHVRTMSEVVADYMAMYETMAAAPVATGR